MIDPTATIGGNAVTRKIIAIWAVLLASTLFLAGTAAAGEYSGNGKFIPGGTTGASICSFSGLDEPDDLEASFPDDALWPRGVQNYGQLRSQGLHTLPFVDHPGEACKPAPQA